MTVEEHPQPSDHESAVPPKGGRPSVKPAGAVPKFVIRRSELPQAPPVPRHHAFQDRRATFNPKWIGLAVVAVLVLAIAEQLFRYRRPAAGGTVASGTSWRGEQLTPLGAEAVLPPGLTEVIPAYLPVLDGLPEGTVDMVQRQLDTAGYRHFPVEVSNSIGMYFRLVPSGDGIMGSPENESGHSPVECLHKVSFAEPFYLGVREVTQAQWCAVMGEEANPSHFRGGELPVEEVTWAQCMAFCRKLCEREGVPTGTYRLPTEAEWEYACRAGTRTAYCFGDNPSQLGEWADYADNNYRGTSPAGGKRPNGLGLRGMHGNVWEWCYDLYRNYPGDDTPRSAAHTYRCVRGGSWYVSAPECRSANRCRLPDRSQGNMLGFRVLRVLTPAP